MSGKMIVNLVQDLRCPYTVDSGLLAQKIFARICTPVEIAPALPHEILRLEGYCAEQTDLRGEAY